MKDIFPGIEKTDIYKKISRCLETDEKQRLINEVTREKRGRVFQDVLIQKVPEGVMVFITDITESKHRELALQAQIDGLLDSTESKQQESSHTVIQRLEAMGQLAAGISHDFNNLLGIIDGNRELLKYKTDDPDLLTHINKIAIATDRAQRLTKRLLRASRRRPDETTAPKMSLIGSLHRAKALLHEVTPVSVRVSWKINFDFLVSVDDEEFQDVFTNLYMNALNALGDEGLLNVETTYQRDFGSVHKAFTHCIPAEADKYIVLSIRDNGCGIAPGNIEKVFVPFASFSKKQGTGLGLAMVSDFVLKNRYGLTIESTLGVGTCVSLWFPAQQQWRAISVKNVKEDALKSKSRLV